MVHALTTLLLLNPGSGWLLRVGVLVFGVAVVRSALPWASPGMVWAVIRGIVDIDRLVLIAVLVLGHHAPPSWERSVTSATIWAGYIILPGHHGGYTRAPTDGAAR